MNHVGFAGVGIAVVGSASRRLPGHVDPCSVQYIERAELPARKGG